MAMAIQYTSNGLSTYLVVHQLIFFQFSSCTCIDSSPQIKGGFRNIERGGGGGGGLEGAPGALPPEIFLSIEFLVSILFFTPLNGKLQF